MQRKNRVRFLATAAAVVGLSVFAQNYPGKPVRLIVPFAPGGTTDIIARVVTAKIGPHFGAPMVVENRSGAGGVIGADETARATPDGYTLGMATVSTVATAPVMMPNVPYDPIRDFTPIINIAATPNVIEVNPLFPARDYQGFIAELKKNPDKYNFASIGVGSAPHMGAEIFLSIADVKMTHVPYRGSSQQAIAALISGDVSMFVVGTSTAVPFVKEGRLRALVTLAPARSPRSGAVATAPARF